MRITGRQLRRIIQEEVARMINEEEVFTDPAAVTGQAAGTLPGGLKPEAIAHAIAAKLVSAYRRASVKDEEYELSDIITDGSTVALTAKIVNVVAKDPTQPARDVNKLFADIGMPSEDVPEFVGEFPLTPVIDITSLTLDGIPYNGKEMQAPRGGLRTQVGGSLPQGMKDRLGVKGAPVQRLPAGSQMTVTVSFKVPAGTSVTARSQGPDGGLRGLLAALKPAIQSAMKVT
jgi:hypothetical protein